MEAPGAAKSVSGVINFVAGVVGDGVTLAAALLLVVLLLVVELRSSPSNSRRVLSTFSCNIFIWPRNDAT